MPDYFALGDTNKDGYIDLDEFRAISETFDLPLEKSKVSMKVFIVFIVCHLKFSEVLFVLN